MNATDTIVEAVEAVQTLRAEGQVWRYTIYTSRRNDRPKVYRELPEAQAREVLEGLGQSRMNIDHELTTARVEWEMRLDARYEAKVAEDEVLADLAAAAREGLA